MHLYQICPTYPQLREVSVHCALQTLLNIPRVQVTPTASLTPSKFSRLKLRTTRHQKSHPLRIRARRETHLGRHRRRERHENRVPGVEPVPEKVVCGRVGRHGQDSHWAWLYLGAASRTRPSHVTDIVGSTCLFVDRGLTLVN